MRKTIGWKDRLMLWYMKQLLHVLAYTLLCARAHTHILCIIRFFYKSTNYKFIIYNNLLHFFYHRIIVNTIAASGKKHTLKCLTQTIISVLTNCQKPPKHTLLKYLHRK